MTYRPFSSNRPSRPATAAAGSMRGFTLVELLVVIGIIAILISILMPSLQKARKSALAVQCMSNLRQWGVYYAIYTNEHKGRLEPMDWSHSIDPSYWPKSMHRYFSGSPKILLCPVASDVKDPSEPVFYRGNTYHAWQGLFSWPEAYISSYGRNGWASSSNDFGWWHGLKVEDTAWQKLTAKGAADAPLIVEAAWFHLTPLPSDIPPPVEHMVDFLPSPSQMAYMVLNRHSGAINVLFLDSSVRRVPLKELWTLKWHRSWDTNGPWSTHNGNQPAWPDWMRKF